MASLVVVAAFALFAWLWGRMYRWTFDGLPGRMALRRNLVALLLAAAGLFAAGIVLGMKRG